jgi:signal transduction histidine kinase
LAVVTRAQLRVYGVLVVILGAIISMLAVDLVTAVAVSRGAETLSTDSIRSVELADDMRWQVDRLPRAAYEPNPGTSQAGFLLQRLEADVAAYEPLATFENERQEWTELHDALAQLKADVTRNDFEGLRRHAQGATASVEQLVHLNRREAGIVGERVGGLRKRQVTIDAIAGLITLLVVFQLGVAQIRSVERERLLTERNLELIQERNRELELFAGRAAHDLRAPLAPIRGLADVLARGDSRPEEVRRLAGRISASTVRMAQVVDDMLVLSRSGQLPAGRASVDETVAAVLEEFAVELQGAQVSTRLCDEQVECASTVLTQILRNLVGNAIKYRSLSRPLKLEVAARAEAEAVVMEVEDNGLGMSPEAVQRAFEPFFRGQSDRDGYGLGLAIVDRYVRAAGGSIGVTSTLEIGTRFEVRLPRVGRCRDPAERQAAG